MQFLAAAIRHSELSTGTDRLGPAAKSVDISLDAHCVEVKVRESMTNNNASGTEIRQVAGLLEQALTALDNLVSREPADVRRHDLALAVLLACDHAVALSFGSTPLPHCNRGQMDLLDALGRACATAQSVPPLLDGERTSSGLVAELADLMRTARSDV